MPLSAACRRLFVGTVDGARQPVDAIPVTTTAPNQAALSTYREFWRITDAAGAAPRSQDWTPKIKAVATGQALKTALTDMFHACWLFATAKDGISAQHLQRVLEISSYQTAWAMLHRLRSALVRPGRDRLSGTVEVDETYIGGEEPGLRGGRQRGKKVLTGIAVEVREPKGIGRCRMAPLDDASGDTLGTFVTENVQPGATVITDGWAAYRAISGKGYQHRPINQKAARAAGDDPDSLLPGVHRVASLCKRWLLGTHQGSVDAAHLPAYLNEFVFRFNRRRAASRGMVFYRVLQLAAGHEPVRYVDLLASKKPRRAKRAEGGTGHPPSLEHQRRTAHGGPPKSSCSFQSG